MKSDNKWSKSQCRVRSNQKQGLSPQCPNQVPPPQKCRLCLSQSKLCISWKRQSIYIKHRLERSADATVKTKNRTGEKTLLQNFVFLQTSYSFLVSFNDPLITKLATQHSIRMDHEVGNWQPTFCSITTESAPRNWDSSEVI